MSALDPSTIIPSRAPLVPKKTWRSTMADVVADGLASVLLNGLVVAFVFLVAFPQTSTKPPPEAISVELVRDVPKPEEYPAPAKVAAPPSSPAVATPSVAAPVPATAPAPSAKETVQDSLSDTAQKPDAIPLQAATPPPLDGNDGEAQPHLVEAPADPRQALRQADKRQPANASPDRTDSGPLAQAKSTPTPPIIASPESSDLVAQPKAVAVKPAVPDAAKAEQAREDANTATLAAALPFSQNFMPDPFRAALSGSGSAEAKAYRGAVYGNFHKADDVVAAARAKNLRGQAVIAFTIDDMGALVSSKVAVSSGNADVDAAALDIIRQSAPFPPPPPGAQHNFAPAIGLGLDNR